MSIIRIQYPSVCRNCHASIPAGTQANWQKGAGVWHITCPARPAAPVAATPAVTNIPPAAWTPRNLVASEVGSYVAVSDPDTIYHVVETRDHQRYYAEKFVVIGGERTTESGTVLNGDWQYERTDSRGNTERYSRLVARLLDSNKLRRMTADEVIDFATLYGRCVQHGGFLKSADSVDAGIGPVCAAKLGIDRKALADAARKRRAASHGRTEATVSHTPSVSAPVASAPQTARETVAAAGGRGDFEDRYAAIFGDADPTVRRPRPFTSARKARRVAPASVGAATIAPDSEYAF